MTSVTDDLPPDWHGPCFLNVFRSDVSVVRGQWQSPRPQTPAELEGEDRESDFMQHRIIRSLPLTLAIALAAGFVTEGAAQDTTRSRTTVTSSRRIPVQKEGAVVESPGAIASDSAARADSIAAAERARADSIAAAERARQDSIAAAERARQDSIAAAERARQEAIAAAEAARLAAIAAAEAAERERFRRGRFNGWYFNLGGGIPIPMGDFDNLYGSGFNVTGSAGWHPTESAFGIRFDAAYDRFNGETFQVGTVTTDLSDASILSGLAEVTLRVPRALGLNPYFVGGGGIYRFSDYGAANESATEWGWNAGGGLRFGWGFTSLFVEARYMSVGTPGDRAEYVPVILGITFR